MHDESRTITPPPSDNRAPAGAPPDQPLSFVADLLKCLHFAMLLLLPDELIMEFWRTRMVRDTETDTGLADLLDAIQAGRCPFAPDELFRLLNDIEPFLLVNKSGVSASRLCQAVFGRVYPGWVGSAQEALQLTNRLLPGFITADDPRHFLLETITPQSGGEYVKVSTIAMARHRLVRGRHDVLLLTTQPAMGPGIDPELWLAPFYKKLPCRFGLPAIERVSVVSSTMDPCAFSGPARIEIADGRLLIDGRASGRCVRFADAMRERGLEIRDFGLADCEVIEARRDYRCPFRGRIIFRRGALYRSPAYVLRLEYLAKARGSGHPLEALIVEAVDVARDPLRKFASRHQRLVGDLRKKVLVEYREATDTVWVNGRYLTKGVAARILRFLLEGFIGSGRTEFARKELLYEKSITSNPKNPNLAIRIQRLSKVCFRHCPELSVDAKPGAAIQLRVSCPIVFRHIPDTRKKPF